MIPLDPHPRWEMGGKPDNLRELGLCCQASSWVKENEGKAVGESLLSPHAYSLVFHGALCAPQASASAGRPGTVYYDTAASCTPQHLWRQSCLFWFSFGLQKRTPPLSYLFAVWCIYSDKAAFINDFMDRKNRHVRPFLPEIKKT